jgi:hypothetical protein
MVFINNIQEFHSCKQDPSASAIVNTSSFGALYLQRFEAVPG